MLHIYQNRSRVQVGLVRSHEYLSLHTARFYAIICVDIDTTLWQYMSLDIFKHTNSEELRR